MIFVTLKNEKLITVMLSKSINFKFNLTNVYEILRDILKSLYLQETDVRKYAKIQLHFIDDFVSSSIKKRNKISRKRLEATSEET